MGVILTTKGSIDPIANGGDDHANIGAGVRPGGRIALVGWRELAHNEWLQCVFTALAAGRDLPVPPLGAPGPFGLADVDGTRATLTAAGFGDIALTAADQPFWMGTDADDAFDFFAGTGIVRGLTRDLDSWQFGQAMDALRASIIDHDTGQGVEFGSGTWLITARKDPA